MSDVISALRARLDVVSSKAAAAFDETVGGVQAWASADILQAWVELGCAIASGSSVAAVKYFRESPSLLEGLAPPRRVSTLEIGRELGREAPNAALEFVRHAPGLLDVLEENALRQWASVAIELTRQDYGAGMEYIKESRTVAGLILSDQWGQWAQIGLHLTREDAAVKDYLALSYFRSSGGWLAAVTDPALRPPLLALAAQVAAAEFRPGSAQRPGQLTIDLLRYGHALLAGLPSREMQQALLALGLQVADRAPRLVGEFLRHAPEVARWVEGSVPRWTEWVQEGLAIADRHLERAEAFFALRSKQAIEVAQRLSHGVFLREIKPTLTYYAEALCGYTVEIHPGPGASSARTDRGGIITLPAQITAYRTRQDNLSFYKVLTLHEAGHLQYGSYDPVPAEVMQWFGGDQEPSEATSLLHRFPDGLLAQNLWTIVEEARIDFRLRHDYPGIRREMDAALAAQLRTRPNLKTLPRRAAILEALLQLSVADTADIPLPILDVVTDGYQLLGRVRTPDATVMDVLRVVCDLYPLVAEDAPPEEPVGDQADPPVSDFDQLAMGHAPMEAFAFRDTLAAPQVTKTQHGGTPGTASPASVQREESPPQQSQTPSRKDPDGGEDVATQPAQGSADGWWYDEWDAAALEWKPRWCRVEEHEADEGDPDDVNALLAAGHGTMTSLIRGFEAIRPDAFRKCRGQADGDDIDLDAALAARVERRAGRISDGRWYVRREKQVRDVAAAFLIDVSGSTGRQIGGSPPRRVIDVERESLALLGAALHALGDEYAMYGFSGQSRLGVACRVVKDFETPWGPRVLSRIGGLQPGGQNRDGAAIRHLTQRLGERSAAVKLLIIVSDGRPLDDAYEGLYALEDTRVALQDAKARGIRPFCVTVDERAHQYIHTMYRDLHYTVIHDAASLPERLPRLYKRLTT